MPRYRLDGEVAPNVEVFGISCHVPDYRLCWSLNRSLGLCLTRRRADIVEGTKDGALHYPVFEQMDEEGMRFWWLVGNTCGKRRLLPQQKQADFFLVMDTGAVARDPSLIGRLRGAEFVLTAYAIEPGALKMGHKLLL